MTVGVRTQNATAKNPSVGGVDANASVSNVKSGIAVGFLQVLTDDFRGGTYHPVPDPTPPGSLGGQDLFLDFSPCVRPFLPCRDIEESTNRFSLDDPAHTVDGNRSSSGLIRVADAPGNGWERRHRDLAGKTWELARGTWAMKFVVLLGVFKGGLGLRPSQMMILQHANWEFFAEIDPQNIIRLSTGGDNAFRPGAPAGLDLLAATSGKTCRMTVRSINFDNPTTGEQPCRALETVGPRPPIP
jgi:hypothetical protein